jgi:hypothetical protein
MEEHRHLDDISTEEFRNLQEAPLTATDNTPPPDDAPIVPTGESIDYQATADQNNKFGGQVQEGILGASPSTDIWSETAADEDVPPGEWVEILESDLDDMPGDNAIHSPEMADMNVPGEIDIEDLGEDDLDGTDLPEDARLDRLEE